MQKNESFSDVIKQQIRDGGMTTRLIAVNIGVFLFVNLLEVIFRLFGGLSLLEFLGHVNSLFRLQTDLSMAYLYPITLVTSIFTQYNFLHLAGNMLVLFFAGKFFEQVFNAKRLLYTYLVCGISGGLLEIIAHLVFPQMQDSSIVGASGSVMGIFAAIAFYRPNTVVNLFGILPVKIIILALIYILSDFLNLGMSDGTAHFAHLGGAMIGILSIQNLSSSNNMVTLFQRFIESFLNLFKRNKGIGNSNMKVKHGGRKSPEQLDEEFLQTKKQKQEMTDAILDKISKSGYESLTKAEKDFLFKQSKNG